MARLADGEVSVLELAAPFAMSQPAISKHLKVLVTLTSLFESRGARDMAIESGMEEGVAISYDRLADLLEQPPPEFITASECFAEKLLRSQAVDRTRSHDSRNCPIHEIKSASKARR